MAIELGRCRAWFIYSAETGEIVLRLRAAVLACVVATAGAFASGGQATAATVTVAPAAGDGRVDNCWFFGQGPDWSPHAGFVYKDIPPFKLAPGGTIAFDTWTANNTDIQFNIALAATTSNGSDDPAGPFTPVVSNTQTASTPRGNATAGDFDLKFTAQAPFSFPGGGLVIRFSDPAGAFARDRTCNNGLVGAVTASDSSGFFVKRFYLDQDGGFPWTYTDMDAIGAFEITTDGPSSGGGTSTTTPLPAMPRDTTAPVITKPSLSSSVFAVNARAEASAAKGSRLFLTLSEPATVVFVTEQRVGRRWRKVRIFGKRFPGGTNRLNYSGKIKPRGKQRALKPGRYRLRMRPSDRAGNKGKVSAVGFKIAE